MTAAISVGAGLAIAAGAAAVGTVAAGAISSSNASKAAGAQVAAANSADQTQLAMYNQTRDDQAPWRTAGSNALTALQGYYGLGGTAPTTAGSSVPGSQAGLAKSVGTQNGGMVTGSASGPGAKLTVDQGMTASGQPTAATGGTGTASGGAPTGNATADADNALIQNLPGYQFNLQQGNSAVQKNLAASGLLDSGAAQKALTQYGQGMATSASTQYLNGLQSLAGLGQTATAQTGAAGSNAANQIGSNQIYAGNAQASGYAGQSNAIGAGLSGLTGIYSNYNTQQQIGAAGAGSSSGYGLGTSGGGYTGYNWGDPGASDGYIMTGLT